MSLLRDFKNIIIYYVRPTTVDPDMAASWWQQYVGFEGYWSKVGVRPIFRKIL